MTNNLNEKRNYAAIIAAIVCTLVLTVGGLATGLVFAVRRHNEQDATDAGRQMAQYLLEEAADELRHSMSALRLCNEKEPAEAINRTALVHAVRAETALECHVDEWADNRDKEAFLNDISEVLHSYATEKTIELSEKMYEYSSKFYFSLTRGETFEYDGELVKSDGVEKPPAEVTQEEKDKAAELVKTALEASRVELVGAWNGHIEFYTEKDGRTGYAVVCGGKIKEFSFTREDSGESDDVEEAKRIALEAANKCGYTDLKVKWSEKVGRSIAVVMCREYGGALATDDCATAVVYGGVAVAFNAGGCDHTHENIPVAKKSEIEARKATKNGASEGVLVVHTVGGEERVCYEYRYELDDGVHYVYVCAENGKQIEVK